jgi:predicted phosphodiesterase
MDIDKIIRDALKKHPDQPTMTLAKMIYKEHPKAFISLESCRSSIRYRRGNMGKRHKPEDQSLFRPNQKAGWTVPKSIAKKKKPYKLQDGKWLILSDIHIPYHDDQSLQVALQYGEDAGIDHILLNGDTCDFFAVSRWLKDPEERNLSQELQMTRQLLGHIRQRFPEARIVYKIGNHEDRWENYMYTKAPELVGTNNFEMSSLLDFNKFGITEVKSKQLIKAGKYLTIIHGHEKFGGSSVNPARGLYNQMKVCSIMGHHHQSSSHAEKTADDKFVACWSLGCLCELTPDYAPINKWNHGFAILDLMGNDFNVNNLRIVNGRVNHL